MRKEIGSIFPLSDDVLSGAENEIIHFSRDRIYYSLCREALYAIAQTLAVTSRVVLIPAYTCQTVITPFEETGWHCVFYSISKSLRIDGQNILGLVNKYHPSLIIVHPYFGMDLDEKESFILTKLKNEGIEIVLDLTQCLFSSKQYSFASYIVASYRKWMPIPDGGYLRNLSSKELFTQPSVENKEFTERVIAAMYLRKLYFENGEQRTKDISIRLSKAADCVAENNISLHKMSQLAYNLMNCQDIEDNKNMRFTNYSYLFHHIKDVMNVTKVCKNIDLVTAAPLYFTIYVNNRAVLQRQLAQDAIYAPIIWPVEDERVLINDDVKYIYDHLLAIPCDQRYDEADMQRIAEIINLHRQ